MRAKIPCLVMSRGFHLAPECWSQQRRQIAVFRTPMITMKFINAATIALEMDFSPTAMNSQHGGCLGIGVLISRCERIGKSECVLGLIERAIAWWLIMSADYHAGRRDLWPTAPELTRNHMEVREYGIIDVAKVSGSEYSNRKRLDSFHIREGWVRQ